MGMYVSQLRSVPVGRYHYYVYIVDASSGACHSKEVDRFFDKFARQSGVDAVIVRGPQDLSHQVFLFLQEHAQADFGQLEQLFHETTCLVLSQGALQTTVDPIYILPLMLRNASEAEGAQTLDSILDLLVDAMRENKLAELLASLGGVREVSLTEVRGGMFVGTMRRLNEVLHLKPNAFGVGINLNAVIESALGPSQRSLRD